MLVDHFPSEIKRGVVLNGIKNLDDFERYLRMLDGTYEEDRRRGGSRGVFRPPQVRNSSHINSTSRDEGQHRGNTREIRYLTAFNAEPEALLSDPEEEVVEENFESPAFRGIVGEEFTDILIDSGTVSQDFVNQLRDKGVLIHSLPISDVSVSVAVGGKKYRVKEQVLLSVDVESGGNENQRFTFSNICVVIPKLNISVLFGSDWLVAAQVKLDFHRMVLSMPGVGFEIKINFENNAEASGYNRHKYTDSEFRQAVSKSDNLNDQDNRMADSLSRSPLPRITCSSPDMKNSVNVALMNICTWSLVHERLKSNAEKRKKKLNDKTTEFQVGDVVLVRQHPISSAMDATIKKFFLLHEGPYWVSKVVAPNCYQVIDKDGVVIGRHNIKNLKKFVSFNGIS
nr:unnamed protein product [Callosobruchus analis]